MDIALIGNGGGGFDFGLSGGDLLTDNTGIYSAVIVSFFTDRRAEPGDEIPDGTTDRRGSWHDSYQSVAGDLPGSRLWLLSRAKELPETLTRASAYAQEALQWMIDDGVARGVAVAAEWVRPGVLGLRTEITLVDGGKFDDVFNYPVEVI